LKEKVKKEAEATGKGVFRGGAGLDWGLDLGEPAPMEIVSFGNSEPSGEISQKKGDTEGLRELSRNNRRRKNKN